MRFIQKDIDRRLLVFVIILLILLTSFTIYYDISFNKLFKQYSRYQEIFGGLTADAVIEEFNKTSNLRENVQKYKEYVEKRYDELNTINQNLKNENEKLRAQIRLIKSEIEYQKAREISPTQPFLLYQSKVEEIVKLKGKMKELCLKLKALNISDNNCMGID